MTKQEQIEEMAKIIDELYNVYDTTAGEIAEGLYSAGYRKEQETAKEIERLKAENEELSKVVSSKVYDLIDNAKEIADAREAWEKQAKIDVLNELTVKAVSLSAIETYHICNLVDELLKEYEDDTL